MVGSENDDKMGPKKKNKGHNDFYYFMMDKQKEIETEFGKKITDLHHLGQLCAPKWSELDDHAKKKYVFQRVDNFSMYRYLIACGFLFFLSQAI